MSRKQAIATVAGLLLAVAVIVFFAAGRPTAPPVTVSLIGLTNSAAHGIRIARFQIHNRSGQRIARNGYCRVHGDVVDIPPTKTLLAGESELVEVPITSHSGQSVSEVRFNGVRDLSSQEAVRDDFKSWLRRRGINWDWLDTAKRRRWEVSHEFRDDQQ